jgi:hypothetical protein
VALALMLAIALIVAISLGAANIPLAAVVKA